MPKVIAIHSYRGGTGKSNLTANLATTIALQGKRVAIVDTDLQSPGIHTLFGIDERSVHRTLNDYLWNRSPIQDTAYDVSPQLGIETGRLFLVPASVNAEEIARILSEGYNVSLLNDGFQQLIKQLELDYLFIDTHPGLSRETLLSIAISNLLILILRPDQQDFQGTAVTIDVARQLRVRQISLVINKVLNKLDRAALQQQVEATYQSNVAGIFPLTEEMIELGSSGLFCLHHANHPFTQTLNQVATQIVN
ncbi:MinD/ParA family ATP-binding protein [Egbenema bharatensis]|uniref:MinD/ParA family ATP-binding protein n=1 Tax=Egbenema bharatensis TaxID=3463334 RepID=UPI003A8A8C92